MILSSRALDQFAQAIRALAAATTLRPRSDVRHAKPGHSARDAGPAMRLCPPKPTVQQCRGEHPQFGDQLINRLTRLPVSIPMHPPVLPTNLVQLTSENDKSIAPSRVTIGNRDTNGVDGFRVAVRHTGPLVRTRGCRGAGGYGVSCNGHTSTTP